MIIIKCDYCEKDYKIKGKSYIKKHNFCCRKCYHKWQSENIRGDNHHLTKDKIKVNCTYCNKEFLIYESRYNNLKNGRIFCCKECKQKWESENWCGENNPNYSGGNIIKICLCCNKYFEVPKHRENTAKYCSRECKDKYLKDVISKTPEFIELHKNIGIQCMLNQKTKYTKPELLTEQYLIDKNINYIFQYGMYDKFVVDFYLPDNDIIIEVLGDYWHGNPNEYGNDKKPLTEKQIKNKNRDEYREEFLTNKGHSVHMIWESDIYNNIENAYYFLNINI